MNLDVSIALDIVGIVILLSECLNKSISNLNELIDMADKHMYVNKKEKKSKLNRF